MISSSVSSEVGVEAKEMIGFTIDDVAEVFAMVLVGATKALAPERRARRASVLVGRVMIVVYVVVVVLVADLIL
jgi:t-SNARE complex subunit (syntaxin)